MDLVRDSWHRLLNKIGWVTILAVVLFLAIVVISIAAPLITPYEPARGTIVLRHSAPSASHLLGTDHLGRDLLTRILYGGRTSLLISFSAVSLGLLIGGTLGLLAGYFRDKLIDTLIMRATDVALAFPSILLAIVLVSFLGFSKQNLIIAIGIPIIPGYIRITRSVVISLAEEDFPTAALALGASDIRIIFRHLLPNCIGPLIVYSTIYIGRTILSEAGLSFIGLGIQSPEISWGVLTAEGRAYLRSYPILALAPGFAIMLTAFCTNLFGDGLRDFLDPKVVQNVIKDQ